MFLYFCNNLLNACWMYTSIGYKLMQSKTTSLTAYWVKSRNDDCFRCVIYNNFNSTCSLKCPDVSSFSSNDTSFYLVIVNVENRNRVFYCCFCCYPLNCFYNNLLRFVIGIYFRLVHYFIDVALCICTCFIFETFYEPVACFIS